MNGSSVKPRIGFVGLGKLGLPCAAAMSVKTGQKIFGFDVDRRVGDYIKTATIPYQEMLCEEYLRQAEIEFCESFSELLDQVDLLFIAVQTPHEKEFEGTTPVPEKTQDFSYSYLKRVASDIDAYLSQPQNAHRHLIVVVISTVLPGTMRDVVIPALGKSINRIKFCYNPYFIAMGTTIADFLDPEFVLLGERTRGDGDELVFLYSQIHSAPVKKMMIESAELTKVAYNTFIGFKIVFANTLGEIVDARGGNVDEVTDALAAAHGRLISKKYLQAGMADGGGCHPRDQIAMSWLAEDANLSANIFDFLAKARDAQTLRQAEIIERVSQETGLPVCILGAAYKANINLTIGSPSLLLSHFLISKNIVHEIYDPFVMPQSELPQSPHVFFLATSHDVFFALQLPAGSVLIDPWGKINKVLEGVRIIKPGRQIN